MGVFIVFTSYSYFAGEQIHGAPRAVILEIEPLKF